MIVAGDFQAGHHLLKSWVPDVALGDWHLGACKKDHVAAGHDPVMAALAVLVDVGHHGVVAEAGVGPQVFRLGLFDGLLHELGQLLGKLVGVHAHGHDRNPQAHVVAIMRPETARDAFFFLETIPVAGVLQLVNRVGMHKGLEVYRQHHFTVILRNRVAFILYDDSQQRPA